MVELKEPSKKKAILTLHVTTETHFHFRTAEKYHAWSCQNICDLLTYMSTNVFIQFGTILYILVEGKHMRINCDPLVADLFLFCYMYERDCIMSLSYDKKADIIGAQKLHADIWMIF